MEKRYRKGEIVWAKVRGFPWWPAMVKNINYKMIKQTQEDEEDAKPTVLVNFIGDNSHSDLPFDKLEKFNSKFEEYSKTKKKALLRSINLARKMISGEMTYERHLSLLTKFIKSGKGNQEDDKESIVRISLTK